jgi:hypothetical protein
MVKLLEVISRRADLTHAQFTRHQITTHLQVVSRVPEFLAPVRRYMQNHLFMEPHDLAAIKGLPICSTVDSIIEVWYDSVADCRRAFENPRYLEIIRPDELLFGDVEGAWGVTTADSTVMERNGFAGQIKVFIFLKRRKELTHAEFLIRWQDSRDHRLVAAKAYRDHVGRFEENVVGQEVAESLPGMRPFDLVAELWFDSLHQVAKWAADADVIAAIAGSNYIDGTSTLIFVGEGQPAAAEWHRKSIAAISTER